MTVTSYGEVLSHAYQRPTTMTATRQDRRQFFLAGRVGVCEAQFLLTLSMIQSLVRVCQAFQK
jgi:hypothetical protein